MGYDLVVKNGMVVDGSGGARYRADVGVKDGEIVKIGKIEGEVTEETVDNRRARGAAHMLACAVVA